MKKLLVSVMTTATVIGSMTTVGMANGVVHKTPLTMSISEKESPFGISSRQSTVEIEPITKTTIEKLNEEKLLLSTRLFSTEFSTLPISEKLSLLNQSFSLQQSIHNEYKNTLLSSNVTTDIEGLRATLKMEQRSMEKEIQLLEQVLSLSTTDKREELIASKEQLKGTLESLQQYRLSGRELKDMASLKQKTLQASQISILQQVVTSSIEENNIDKAIDSLLKIVEMSEGDEDYLSYLYELLNQDHSYLLWDYKLISLKDAFIKTDDRLYISVDELKKWMDVSYSTDKDKKDILTIKHLEHQITLKKEEVIFDGISMGSPSVWKKDKANKQYVDAEFLFELFGYQADTHSKKNILTVKEEVYPLSELDQLSIDELIDSVLFRNKK